MTPEAYDPVPDLAALLDSALYWRNDTGALAGRVGERLGIGEDDGPAVIADVLRKALRTGLADAAAEFTRVWAEPVTMLPDSYGFTMHCTEANTAAELWEAAGDPATAAEIIAAHAAHDEGDEEHWQGDEGGAGHAE